MPLTAVAKTYFGDQPNFVHVTSLMPDGSPHSVPVWTTVHDDKIAFFTQKRSQKAKNLARDPRVAMSVTHHEDPYKNMQIRGRVVRTIEGDEALPIIDRMSHQYIGEPFPMRSGTVYLVEPETEHHVELPFRHRPV